ncbi:TetR/AcrR family transcriptional regulator [Nocardia asteroides]|uniref:TetR/AcrR family transcriptional regulator n=1 Tax=Nocardia asteroides TaxID=1824 RepID=UPI0033CA2F37
MATIRQICCLAAFHVDRPRPVARPGKMMADTDTPRCTSERIHILDAARRNIAASGLHRFSLNDIMAESGVSAVVLKHHFPSSFALIAATVEQSHADVAAAIRAVLAAEVPDISIRQINDRLTLLMSVGGLRSRLDEAVRVLLLAIAAGLHDDDVRRVTNRSREWAVEAVATTALAWGYNETGAARMASSLLPAVLGTLALRVTVA